MSEVAAFGGAPFSTVVDAWLEMGNSRISLSRVGPSFITPQQGAGHVPAGKATIVMSVDGELFRKDIYIEEPSSLDGTDICFRPDDDIPF